MRTYWKTLCWWLTESRLVSQLTESVLRARSRRHLTRLDQQAGERCQARTLQGLLHQARNTRFGREHDFRRIRTPADFRRLVPIRTPGDFWQTYWQPVFPNLARVTWPGPIEYLLAWAPGEGPGWPVPLTPALRNVHLLALRTALALALQAGSHHRLFSGRLLFADDAAPRPLNELGGPAANLVPQDCRPPAPLYRLLNPNTLTEAVPPGETADRAWLRLCLLQPVTCLAGSPEQLVLLLRQLKELAQPGKLHPTWLDLTAVFRTRTAPLAVVEELQSLVGKHVPMIETVFRPEGVLALTDPRFGQLRLLTDHGLYFEFVPVAQVGQSQPDRLSVDEVQTGVPYEVILTSPAGVWACRSGLTLVFDRLEPPLVRVLSVKCSASSSNAPNAPSLNTEHLTPNTLKVQAPHRQSAGSPARLPETFAHSLWSTPADRG